VVGEVLNMVKATYGDVEDGLPMEPERHRSRWPEIFGRTLGIWVSTVIAITMVRIAWDVSTWLLELMGP